MVLYIVAETCSLLLHSSHICDFVDESEAQNAITLLLIRGLHATTDLRHVDPRSRSITVLRYKERETILRSGREMWSIASLRHRGSMIFSFPAPRQELRHGTEKLQSLFSVPVTTKMIVTARSMERKARAVEVASLKVEVIRSRYDALAFERINTQFSSV